MKAFVTGGNGLIGSHLLRRLHARGFETRALVRATSDTSPLEGLPVSLSIGDVRDEPGLVTAMAGCDTVFHTAVHFSYWGSALGELHETAIEGTRAVLRAARAAAVRRVVVTSSSVTLGAGSARRVRNEDDTADESDKLQGGYVAAKIAQEVAALSIARELGIELLLALPTISMGAQGRVLGPSNGIIASYLADPLKLTWQGGCNVVSASDVAEGHLLLAERGMAGERYVLGSENLLWSDLHARIAKLCGIATPRLVASAATCQAIAMGEEFRAYLTGSPPLATREQAAMVGRYYWYSHSAAGALGYAPRPADDALAEAIAWIAASDHVSRETRTGMRLARSVHKARMAHQAEDREMIARAQA